MLSRILLALLLASSLLAESLSSRYLPYIDDPELVASLEALPVGATERAWRIAAELRELRELSGADLPLAGLRLALDPGHLGGEWAEHEGRNFRIDEADYWVREGELVLEVAQRVRDQLVQLGAEVVLTRESSDPVNPKLPIDYIEAVVAEMGPLEDSSITAMADYSIELRRRAVRRSIVVGELATRARKVNEDLQPDALVSLHINASRWPIEAGEEQLRLVNRNHLHVLVFGCLSTEELAQPEQRTQLEAKLRNDSGPEELPLAVALASRLAAATGLPASVYEGDNAVQPLADQPYVWARNLMLLRQVECPVVLLEPYVANSEQAYPRLQSAIHSRMIAAQPAADDILIEYADAVVAGVLQAYGDAE